MKKPLIGIVDLSMNGWTAGGVVSRTMALSLQSVGADLVFITAAPQSAPAQIRAIKPPSHTYLPGEWTIRKTAGWHKRPLTGKCAAANGVDVLLPDVEAVGSSSLKAIGWIPDFQHLHLSDLYSDEQRALINRASRELSRRSARMLFSSEDCRRDYGQHFPDFAGKARVASFPSLLAFENPPPAARSVLAKYHLPDRFLLVINQFWRHKNHRIVPAAIALLRERGLTAPVVMAGLPSDYRDRQNEAVSETLQAAALGNVWPQCIILGKVPREDLVELLQTATALIQPSRFEGWNTTLQDAKALGCPTIVSDIPVHREQCPEALGFFPPHDAAALAGLIETHWANLPNRPNPEAESAALARETAFARDYGRKLEAICAELT